MATAFFALVPVLRSCRWAPMLQTQTDNDLTHMSKHRNMCPRILGSARTTRVGELPDDHDAHGRARSRSRAPHTLTADAPAPRGHVSPPSARAQGRILLLRVHENGTTARKGESSAQESTFKAGFLAGGDGPGMARVQQTQAAVPGAPGEAHACSTRCSRDVLREGLEHTPRHLEVARLHLRAAEATPVGSVRHPVQRAGVQVCLRALAVARRRRCTFISRGLHGPPSSVQSAESGLCGRRGRRFCVFRQ